MGRDIKADPCKTVDSSVCRKRSLKQRGGIPEGSQEELKVQDASSKGKPRAVLY